MHSFSPDLNLRDQRSLNRAAVRDLHDPRPLLLIEVALEFDPFGDLQHWSACAFTVEAVLRAYALLTETDRDSGQRPALPVGVHPNGHGHTCTERSQQQLVRRWSRIRAAD